jgi:hypothetical protein
MKPELCKAVRELDLLLSMFDDGEIHVPAGELTVPQAR